jgi:pimeloyl-ACP methyl ester carboxylesterase
MKRTKLALAIFACVLATLAIPAVAAPPSVDQAAWVGLKKEIVLPTGIRLAYVELGDPAGPPLVLLHGYTDTSRSWSLAAPYLSDYRLIIPDQRGHGDADAPRCCYSLSAFADDAQLLLTALKIDRAAVAGHSLGSMIAMTMAAEYPERVSAIVLVGSTASAPVKRGDWLYDSVAALRGPLDPASQFAKDWHPANQPTPVDPAFAEAVNSDLYRIPPHVWRAVLRELAEVPAGRHAAEIKAPVLILSGGKDPLFGPPHHASLLKAFPQAEAHVFPELGHNPNWEQPDAVARRIDRFLQSRD